MEKGSFDTHPLLGKQISLFVRNKNLKNLKLISLELEHYFIERLYGQYGSVPHDHTPVCSLVIFPLLQKKGPSLMLGIENGHLALKDQKDGYIQGKSNDELAKKFFTGFLGQGISISFQTDISFFSKSYKDKPFMLKKKQGFQVAFILRYASDSEIIIHDLKVTKCSWNLTKEEKFN